MRSRRTLGVAIAAAVIAIAAAGVGLLISAEETSRPERLAQQLKCPGCGATVAEADGPTADRIRSSIAEQVAAGRSDQQVLDEFVGRYGEWILVPSTPSRSPWRWAVPAGLLALGVVVGMVVPTRVGAESASARRAVTIGAGGLVIAACLVAGWLLTVEEVDHAPPPTDDVASVGDLKVDPATVSDDKLAEVIAEHPDVVGMRLALVERQLAAGDITGAHANTAIAIDQDASPSDHQRVLKFHGWTTALLGDPATGADLLRAALELVPEDRDAKFYLARVELTGLHHEDIAVELLTELLQTEMDPAQEQAVRQALDEARQG